MSVVSVRDGNVRCRSAYSIPNHRCIWRVYVKNNPVPVRWPVRLDVTRPEGTAHIRYGQPRGEFVGMVGLPGQALPEQLKLRSIRQ